MGLFLTIVLIIVFFAVLVLGHEAGHFVAAKLLRLEVKEFGLGFPPKLIGKKIRGTEYSLNAVPFGGFVKIPALDDSLKDKSFVPAWKRAIVLVSGVAMNFIIAWAAFSLIFMMGSPKGVYVSGVFDGSPAEFSGLKAGDKFKEYDSIDSVIAAINSNAGKTLFFKIERPGKTILIEIVPENKNGAGRIGVELIESGFAKEGFFKGIVSGLGSAWSFSGRIISAFAFMFRHADFSSGSGPVGIFTAVSVAKDMDFVYFLQLLGVVSLNLMIINIFPLPALDGGHLIFLAVEKLRGKSLGKNIKNRINSISFIFLLVLMFVVTIRDILRLF